MLFLLAALTPVLALAQSPARTMPAPNTVPTHVSPATPGSTATARACRALAWVTATLPTEKLDGVVLWESIR